MGNNVLQNLTKFSGAFSKSNHQDEGSKTVFYIIDHDVGCEESVDFRIRKTDHGEIETYLVQD